VGGRRRGSVPYDVNDNKTAACFNKCKYRPSLHDPDLSLGPSVHWGVLDDDPSTSHVSHSILRPHEYNRQRRRLARRDAIQWRRGMRVEVRGGEWKGSEEGGRNARRRGSLEETRRMELVVRRQRGCISIRTRRRDVHGVIECGDGAIEEVGRRFCRR
jgi:hypothetical protein